MTATALALAVGMFSGHSLDSPMGSCSFESSIVDDLFTGTLFQCRWADESGCESGRRLDYSRGRAKIGETDYETGSGFLCVPSVGIMLKVAGTILWQSEKKSFETKFELSTRLVSDRVVEGSLEVEAHVVVSLRRR